MKHNIVLPVPADATLIGKILAVFRFYNTKLTAKQVSVILDVTNSSVAAALTRARKENVLTDAGKCKHDLCHNQRLYLINLHTFEFHL
jgi:hypothetical protein